MQPGIESLIDDVLKLMRKGVSALHNVQLLKWCKEIGVKPHWNVLWGFPGEPAAEYERLARVVPWLRHLPPPRGFGPIRLNLGPVMIAFRPDGRFLAAAGGKGRVTVFAADGTGFVRDYRAPTGRETGFVRYSPDGRFLAAFSSDDEVAT